ncbi:MAG: hypothetical protein M3X11_11025 [Acidobacteriota bacterium]|nr:hypothetical protein [Acidobacteriota bacterium]
MNKQQKLVVSLVSLALVSTAIWWFFFKRTKPVPEKSPSSVKLTISNYGTIVGVTDDSGNDLAGRELLYDGYTIVYQIMNKAGQWERKTLNVVGDQVTDPQASGRQKVPAYYAGTTTAIVTVPAQQPDLKIVNSFWVNPANGEILMARSVLPVAKEGKPAPKIETVETYSNASKFESKSKQRPRFDRARGPIVDRTCWPCNDPQAPICAARLTGPPAREYLVCLNCSPKNVGPPRPFPMRGASETEARTRAMTLQNEQGDSCLNFEIFPYGRLGIGIPTEVSDRHGYVLFCANCELMGRDRTGAEVNRSSAFAIHSGSPTTIRADNPECNYLIRYGHWDVPADEIDGFAIIETRTLVGLRTL